MKTINCDVCGEEIKGFSYATDIQFQMIGVLGPGKLTNPDIFPVEPIEECCFPCRDMLWDSVVHAVASQMVMMRPKPKGENNEKN